MQARGIRGSNVATKARLTYFQDVSLKLELRYKSEEEWTLCFETTGVNIPSVSYLGFSAETGELSDDFDIISVETKNLYSTQASDSNKGSTGTQASSGKGKGKGKKNRTGSGGSGWLWFFVKVLLGAGVLGGGYVGWTYYRNSQRHSRFD